MLLRAKSGAMEDVVAAPEGNCESEHRHGKCSKCFGNPEKNLPQPPIDEKHKQRNKEILERKKKISNAGREMSRKMSGLESHEIAAKLALKRQQQKKVEVFDSHAIDFKQYKDTDDSEMFLPRHLKKRKSTQSLNLNKTKLENNVNVTPNLKTLQTGADDETEGIDGEEGLEVLRSVEELRRASLAYGIFGPQRNSAQHDTLRAYFKFRKDNMARENRLKKVQAKAKIRETDDEAVNSPNMIRKALGSYSRTVLPSLKSLSSQNENEAKADSGEIKTVHNNDKMNITRRGKLPKISCRKSKGKEGTIGFDPRFQKLISCLAPLSEKSGVSPPFTRKRHYTM